MSLNRMWRGDRPTLPILHGRTIRKIRSGFYMKSRAFRRNSKYSRRAITGVRAKYPNLRMVGVHLGSMEKNLDEIMRHFNQFPNFAVDVAARMDYLMIAPREKTRDFFIKNQDRILYGTDLDLIPTANIHESLKEWKATYARDWKFLATDKTFDSDGKKFRTETAASGTLQNFPRHARHWIPGL